MNPPAVGANPQGEFSGFARLERESWGAGERVEGYAALFLPAARQAIPALLAAAGAAPGTEVLDLCCGDGVVAQAAHGQGCRVTGVDFSPAMLALAGARNPGLPFVAGDAQDLPMRDGQFDAVLSNFGLCHVPDPARALREARRVLRTGGRLAATAWCGPARSPAFAILYEAIRGFGDPAVQLPQGPDFHQLADAGPASTLLEGAGFSDVGHAVVEVHWDLAAPGDLCTIFERGTARAGALLAAQPPGCLARIRAAMAREVEGRFRTGDRVRVPMPAGLVHGRAAQVGTN